MATREIKATLALDGEKKFAQQIRQAQSNLRALKAEVKAESAEFEANGNAMAANEAKLKSLGKQQEQQREIVKALEQAVEDAGKKFGENSTQVDGYRIKLANARSELANMEQAQNRIQAENAKTAKSFGQLKQELAANWNDVAGQMGNAMKGVAAAAAGVFASVAAAATAAGKSVFDWTVEAAHNADDVITQAQVTGIDTATLQQWSYASKFIDTSVDAITGSIKKLEKNMMFDPAKPDKSGKVVMGDVEAAFTALGVRVKDEANQYRDAQDVFWEVLAQVSNDKRFKTKAEKDDILRTLVGNGYDQLAPLMQAGKAAWDAMGQEALEKDIVIDDETLAAFNEFDDTLNKINADFEAIKTSIAGLFLPGTQEAASAVEELAATFNKFLHGDASAADVAAAAQETVEAVTNAVKHGIEVTNEIIGELQASDDPNVKAVGDLLAGVRDAGMDLWENKDKIVGAVEAIATVWAAGKIAGAVNNIIHFTASLGNLLGTMLQIIEKAASYGAAMETIQSAGAAGAAGTAGAQGAAGVAGAGLGTVAAAAVAAGAASIFAETAKQTAAEAMQQAVYNATEGTEQEKINAGWNARYDVEEPGMTGAFEIAKWIAGLFGWKPNEQAETTEQMADDVKDMGAAADTYYNNAQLQGHELHRYVLKTADAVDSTMADLSRYVDLMNQQREMERNGTGTDAEYDAVMEAIEAIDAAYGGSILSGSEQGRRYLQAIGGAGAFEELPGVDIVFNLVPADETEANLQQFAAGIKLSVPVQLVPVMDGIRAGVANIQAAMQAQLSAAAGGTISGFNASTFRAGAASAGSGISGTSGNLNVEINLDGRTIGNAVAPIVNQQIGSMIRRQ